MTIEKKEATDEDIILLRNTLWQRANNVRYNPNTRVSFHAILILQGIGGFRPIALMRLPYGQVHLAVVQDPKNLIKT
jgi:hypothetical protein